MKKTRKPSIDDEDIINSFLAFNIVAKVTTSFLIITSLAYDNNGGNQLIMVTAWLNNLQMPKSLFDSSFIVEPISQSVINK